MQAAALQNPIPPPSGSDAEDAGWSLQTAAALWSRGDAGAALAWLRRAANAAADAGDDQRALELFKVAADLATLLQPGPVQARPRVSSAPRLVRPESQPLEEAPRAQPATDGRRRTSSLRLVAPGHDADEEPTQRGLFPAAERTSKWGRAGAPTPRRQIPTNPGWVSRPSAPAAAARYDDLDEETAVLAGVPARAAARPALRVALQPSRAGSRPRLAWLAPGAAPPPGAASAMLVPATERDAQLIAALMAGR